jgi:hypothetical protein
MTLPVLLVDGPYRGRMMTVEEYALRRRQRILIPEEPRFTLDDPRDNVFYRQTIHRYDTHWTVRDGWHGRYAGFE